MRLDRTIALGPGRLISAMTPESGAIPVLMYHRISDEPESVGPYYKLNTSPARFDEQLQWLNELGYRSVRLDEKIANPSNDSSTTKRVVITFDDGFRDFYDLAFPILRKHDHIATMFLPTSYIGEQRRKFKGTECMTWKEIRQLRAQGIQFGSHTVSHPRLYDLSWKEIETELAVSKDVIEQETGERTDSFAYPYAFPQEDPAFASAFSEVLERENYRTCVTTVIGRVVAGANPFCLKRLPVNDCDDRRLLEAKLNGAYDWFGYPQNWSRTIRRWIRGGRQAVPISSATANELPASKLPASDLRASESTQKFRL